MSATPTLVPDPTVMVVQGAIFLTAVYTVNKLFLQPYLKLRGSRLDATSGLIERSTRLGDTNQKIIDKIDEEIAKTKSSAREKAEAISGESKAKREELVASADAAANDTISQASSALAQKLAEEEAKLSAKLEQITDAMLQKVMQ